VVLLRQHTVLHTIDTGGPGGAETILLELASRLDPAQFRSLVVLSNNGWLQQQLEARGVETRLVKWKAWYDLRLPRVMAELVRREKVGLIHSHLPDHNFYSCLVGRWTRCKTIVTYHGPVELAETRRARNAFKLWLVRKSAAAAVVVCDHVGHMLEEASFPPERIVRIYNGIETSRFATPISGHLREELGCGRGTKLVGMVANVRQSKGYEFFIQAARRVTESMSEVLFLAVGDVDERIGRGLQAEVERLRLHDKFRFLGFRSDVPEILRQFDIFVLSSTSEGFPLVVLEAMAAGKPVVVTRCGGLEEMVEDGREGFLIPPADAEALASRISELLSNPALGTALGENGQMKVVRQFSLERMVKKYENLYQRYLPPD
jgi:glycosyltransferase involved in cell wall biosynthesis